LVGIREIETGERLDLNSIDPHWFEFIKEEVERQAIFETTRTKYDSTESTESIMRLIKTSGFV